MRIKKNSSKCKKRKRTSFKRLKLHFYLFFNKPKASERKGFVDLVLELLYTIPNCVKNAPIFKLKLTKMSAANPIKEDEPTNEELIKIQRDFSLTIA